MGSSSSLQVQLRSGRGVPLFPLLPPLFLEKAFKRRRNILLSSSPPLGSMPPRLPFFFLAEEEKESDWLAAAAAAAAAQERGSPLLSLSYPYSLIAFLAEGKERGRGEFIDSPSRLDRSDQSARLYHGFLPPSSRSFATAHKNHHESACNSFFSFHFFLLRMREGERGLEILFPRLDSVSLSLVSLGGDKKCSPSFSCLSSSSSYVGRGEERRADVIFLLFYINLFLLLSLPQPISPSLFFLDRRRHRFHLHPTLLQAKALQRRRMRKAGLSRQEEEEETKPGHPTHQLQERERKKKEARTAAKRVEDIRQSEAERNRIMSFLEAISLSPTKEENVSW